MGYAGEDDDDDEESEEDEDEDMVMVECWNSDGGGGSGCKDLIKIIFLLNNILILLNNCIKIPLFIVPCDNNKLFPEGNWGCRGPR